MQHCKAKSSIYPNPSTTLGPSVRATKAISLIPASVTIVWLSPRSKVSTGPIGLRMLFLDLPHPAPNSIFVVSCPKMWGKRADCFADQGLQDFSQLFSQECLAPTMPLFNYRLLLFSKTNFSSSLLPPFSFHLQHVIVKPSLVEDRHVLSSLPCFVQRLQWRWLRRYTRDDHHLGLS